MGWRSHVTTATLSEEMAVPVELTHIGEDLVAAMLDSLSQRQALGRVVCEVSGRTLAQDILESGLGSTISFFANDADLFVQTGERVYSCDGEQTVDVLCSGDKLAIAFEAKLGLERMGSAEFHRRFCIPCEPSKHADDRISGSMVAVLERSLPFGGSCDLLAQIGNAQWQLTPGWWLVLRRPIVERWRKTGNFPVEFARIISIEALVHLYGSRQLFDQLVQRVVGSDFAGRWGIALNDP